ncbi:MAG: KH domain-containing protein [Terriglobales bacterium]
MSEPSMPRPASPDADMQQLIEFIAKSLVDTPDQVSVEAVPEGDTTVIELTVAETDIGRVIGKQGRTARAFRAILGAAGDKLERRFTLEILE